MSFNRIFFFKERKKQLDVLLFQAALVALAAHTSESSEADRLNFLSSPQGKVEETAELYCFFSQVDTFLSFPLLIII